MSLTGFKVGTGLAWPFAVLAELGPVVQKTMHLSYGAKIAAKFQ